MIRLEEPFTRGDTFRYSFTIADDWDPVVFDDVMFTLRTEIPPSDQEDDDDETVVYKCSLSSGHISFVGQIGTVEIPAADTKAWPTLELFGDIQTVSAGEVFTPKGQGRFILEIEGDITRRTS